MARRLLAVALAVTVVSPASGQIDLSRSRLAAPATFRTKAPAMAIGEQPPDELYVLVDSRFRLPVSGWPSFLPPLRRGARIPKYPPVEHSFTPHDFMLDGKAHRVEWTVNGKRVVRQMVFPKLPLP